VSLETVPFKTLGAKSPADRSILRAALSDVELTIGNPSDPLGFLPRSPHGTRNGRANVAQAVAPCHSTSDDESTCRIGCWTNTGPRSMISAKAIMPMEKF
jgi:hypothetical protein